VGLRHPSRQSRNASALQQRKLERYEAQDIARLPRSCSQRSDHACRDGSELRESVLRSNRFLL
jgi:hypothetical protein